MARTELKLQTKVELKPSNVSIAYNKPIMLFGSCFADSIGHRLQNYGFDVLLNPFGSLYNPVSIANSLQRIISCQAFAEEDCVEIGAGDKRICSFSHHTLRAKSNKEEFLSAVNTELMEANSFWHKTTTLIITLGTAWCYAHLPENKVVSNCLKHVPNEFKRFILSTEKCREQLDRIIDMAGNRDIIFTISPIRHMADGAHGNMISKSTLFVALEEAMRGKENVAYFPSFEILYDELRDYRFYAEDMVHPSEMTENYIFNRFIDYTLQSTDFQRFETEQKEYRRRMHRPNGVG